MATDTLLALCTCPDEPTAQRLAHGLVDQRLAACVNILPGIESVYRWDGTVKSDAEILLLIKTTAERWDALEALIREQHPYELPEIVGIPVTRGLAPYLDWITDETTTA